MFILLPVGMDYRARRYPVVTFTLMGVCTLVYLVTLGYTASGDSEAAQKWVFQNLWLIPAKLHWWTFLTSLFVHGGFLHLLGNMIFLFLFGACVEDLIGRFRFIIFYLLCGIGGTLFYLPFASFSEVPMGGASGAISGCIGGYLLLRAKGQIEFKWIFFFWFRVWNGEFMLPAWVAISWWFLKQFVWMILDTQTYHRGGTAFAAHVGGTLVGMGLIGLLRLTSKRPVAELIDDPEEKPEAVMNTPIRVRLRPATTLDETATVHLSWNGTESGPFSSSQIERMFRDGEIPADAIYWQEGMEDWRTAEELREPGVA